jgi:hypothetical protein
MPILDSTDILAVKLAHPARKAASGPTRCLMGQALKPPCAQALDGQRLGLK